MSRKQNGQDESLSFERGLNIEDFRPLLKEQITKLRTRSVMWGIPCDEVGYSRFWIKFERHAHKLPWDDFGASEGTYLPMARNFIHKSFLTISKASSLMMLDSDVMFPPYIADLLERHKKPIVGGWYRDKKAADHHPAVYDWLEEKDGVDYWKHKIVAGVGLEQVDGMGAGCWLMTREVAEALGEEPYDLNSGGEDFKLSRKLMKLGIPMFVDWSINCAHIGVGHI